MKTVLTAARKAHLKKNLKTQAEFIQAESIVGLAYKFFLKHPDDFFIYFQPIKTDGHEKVWQNKMDLELFDEMMRDFSQEMWDKKFAFHNNGIFKCLAPRKSKQKAATLEQITEFFMECIDGSGI